MDRIARRTLPSAASAAKTARAFVRETAGAGWDATVIDDVELLASELVTNAVRYGRPPIDLELRCGSGCVLLSVHDGGSHPPRLRRVSSDDAGGRGLHLVDLLSDTWGHQIDRTGKTVWFTLNL